MRSLAIVLLITACAQTELSAPPIQHAPSSKLDLIATVHDVLAQHCGKCHEGRRASAVPEALAVFDLDRSDWPARFDSRQRFEVALQRLASTPTADRKLFLAFRDARAN